VDRAKATNGRSRHRFGRILLILCLGATPAACQGPSSSAAPEADSATGAAATGPVEAEGGSKPLHIASNGWHSAAILARGDIPSTAVPEIADFPEARYLAFGWGDAVYYPAPKPTFLMTLYAGLIPSPAVVHVIGLARHPRDAYPTAEIVTLDVSHAGFRGLLAYLSGTFDRKGAARASPTAPGRHDGGLFYPATGSFHMFNTCNSWTAGALRAAGWRIEAEGTLVAEDLMAKLRKLSPAGSPRPDGGGR